MTITKESLVKSIHNHLGLTIHDDISLMHFVIPGLTRNPGFFWIPAFAGMKRSALINVAMYKTKSNKVVESLFKIMKNTLESGEDVLISGFGKFCVRKKSERKGRNPANEEDIMLRARRVVAFKCSGVLKDKINGKK